MGRTFCGINKLIQTTAFSQEKVVDELLHWKGCQEEELQEPDRYDRFKGSAGPVPFKVVDGQDIVILRIAVDASLSEIDAVFLDPMGQFTLGGELIPAPLSF